MTYQGLHKVISGGQTGADQGGLIAAKLRNLATGGTAPANFMTSSGPEPTLGTLYGLIARGTLQSRTKQNIVNSDATLVLSNDMVSPGTRLTRNTCKTLGKPCFEFDTTELMTAYGDTFGDTGGVAATLLDAMCRTICLKLIRLNVGVLNVAGNRERYPTLRTTMLTSQIVGKVIDLLEHEGLVIHPL